jgi:VanZ family protein
LFAVLTGLARVTFMAVPSWVIFLLVTLVALADELHQLNLPGRSADIKDLLADLAGVGLTLVIIVIAKSQAGSKIKR